MEVPCSCGQAERQSASRFPSYVRSGHFRKIHDAESAFLPRGDGSRHLLLECRGLAHCCWCRMVRVAVLGLWHQGTVTAGCLAAAGHEVTAIDADQEVINGLTQGRLPVDEPGLEELIRSSMRDGRLRFTTEAVSAAGKEVVWIAYDTPVDDDDQGDAGFVCSAVARLFPLLTDGTVVLISSQLPVGSIARLETEYRSSGACSRVSFACSPENLRLGSAIEVFSKPDRVVAGIRSEEDKAILTRLWRPFTTNIEWMSVESAEMTKHALNGFLAVSIAYINEIATLCEKVGADAAEVERGLKTDLRIGNRAYLHPGGGFGGGTLARDLSYLRRLGGELGTTVDLLDGANRSNIAHKQWIGRRLRAVVGSLQAKQICVLGLTYKPGTNTLRRSTAVELCTWMAREGAVVQAFDPAIRVLPEDIKGTIRLAGSAAEALQYADAAILSTPWPEFRQLSPGIFKSRMRRPVVFDPDRFLETILGHSPELRYFAIGRPDETAG